MKTKNILKVFLGIFSFAAFLFILAIFPYIFTALLKIPPTLSSFENVSTLNPSFEWGRILFSLFFILIFCLANLWFFIYNKEKYIAIIKNIRIARIFHAFAMGALGFYLTGIPLLSLNFFDWLLIIAAVLSGFFLWLSVIGHNDILDEKIDKISNPQRPLFNARFSRDELKSLSAIFLIIAYFLAFAVSYVFFALSLLLSFVAYVYSSPPFRLKKFPVVATFTLALSYLIVIFIGYTLPLSKSMTDFPIRLAIFILLAFTFGFMTKDIKDYEGDRKEKIHTIPVIFGLKTGKLIIGVLSLFVFLLTPFFFPQYFNVLVFLSFLAGTLSFWLINRERYSERPLFFIYFSFGLFFILSVF